MSAGDPLARVRSLPRGAEFLRCALQVNPSHYAGTFRGRSDPGDAAAHAKAIVEKAVDLGISVLAITDHNNVQGVPFFQNAARGTRVRILPGFELSSSEGIHVLCIYPHDTEELKLERFLGGFGMTNTSPSSDLCESDFCAILGRVREQGGIAVAAHVTNDKGLLSTLAGKARIQAWQAQELLAVQIPGPVEDLPPEVRQIVENRNADYRRRQPAGDKLALAVINARDVVRPEDLEERSATCWIKMSEVSVEGLRQAFLDPGSRVRLNPTVGELEPEEHSELVAVAWEGGFLDGAGVHFNPNLNVLVGGRGTGKSTVVESIRSVLGLDAVGEVAQKAHDGIVRQVLKNGTRISLLVRVSRPAVREYRIERTLPNPPLVRDDQGRVSNLSPRDILPRIEVYGQHELSELTRSREKLTRLLDRFVDQDEALLRRKTSLRRDLEKSRRGLLDARAELRQIEGRLAALPGLEETLERFREAGLEERLREQSLLVREERVLATVAERIEPFREVLESVRQDLPIDIAFLSERALKELPGRQILSRANEVFKQLERDLERVVKELRLALERADAKVAAVRSDWEIRQQSVQVAYEKILRDLQKSRVDGEEFIRLRRQIEELRPLRERQIQVRRVEKELAGHRRVLLAEWEDLKAEQFRHLDRAAKSVSKRLPEVQVDVEAGGDREPLFQALRDGIGGRLSEAINALASLSDLSLPHLVEVCRSGAETLSRSFGIVPAQAERIAAAEPEVLMRVEELDLPPTTEIRLNTAPMGEPPEWQALEDLSTGQKATAVLLLLLLESEAPLIVDQPEDDLDNRFITEGVVPRMREEKRRRQFIFSTHNANIPVLGDAEMIVGLSASGDAERGHARIARDHMGSIDARPVRELVEEILEGGKEAFEMRRRKYGF